MFRKLLKWQISAAIDRDAELPAALRARVERDSELAAFESASRALAARLRREAPAWLEQQASSGEGAATAVAARYSRAPSDGELGRAAGRDLSAHSSGAPAKAALASLALAASVLVAIALWHVRGPGRYRHMSEADRQQLIEAVKAGRASLAQVAHAIKKVDVKLPWPSLTQDGRLTAEEEARASAARAMTAFDRRVQTQRSQLAAGAESAFDFFTVRLPQSMAILVGLQAGERGEAT